MPREISESRRITYYFGMILVAIGLILFFSAFFALATQTSVPAPGLPSMPDMSHIPGVPYSQCSVNGQPVTCDSLRSGFPRPLTGSTQAASFDPITPVVGIILCVIGGFMMNYGRLGAAGSGLILNPAQARRDLQPWSNAVGGVIDDVVSGSAALERPSPSEETHGATVVKVRCSHCHALNDEDAKFCSQCGKQL